jgi:hypothetical protein
MSDPTPEWLLSTLAVQLRNDAEKREELESKVARITAQADGFRKTIDRLMRVIRALEKLKPTNEMYVDPLENWRLIDPRNRVYNVYHHPQGPTVELSGVNAQGHEVEVTVDGCRRDPKRSQSGYFWIGTETEGANVAACIEKALLEWANRCKEKEQSQDSQRPLEPTDADY